MFYQGCVLGFIAGSVFTFLIGSLIFLFKNKCPDCCSRWVSYSYLKGSSTKKYKVCHYCGWNEKHE